MRTFRTFATLLLILPFASSFASDCVKVRDGKEGYKCMRFSMAEKSLAAKYGLSLGMKYQEAHSALLKNGWKIDPEWMKENSLDAQKARPVCGNGYDAVCSISYAKDKRTVSFYLSGTNKGLPLVGIKEGN